MPRIAILVGSGYFGEDLLSKEPWIRHLGRDIEVYVATRIDDKLLGPNSLLESVIGQRAISHMREMMENLRSISRTYENIYDSSFLHKRYESHEINELQNWLGLPYKYVSSFDRRFFNRRTQKDQRDLVKLGQFLAGLTEFFRDFYERNKITVLVTTIEDDAFSVIAYYVARRLGIRVVGTVAGRFPVKGLMFCDDFREVLVWNSIGGDFSKVRAMYGEHALAGKETMSKNTDYWATGSVPKRIRGILGFAKNERASRLMKKIHPNETFIIEKYSAKTILKYVKGFIRMRAVRIFVDKTRFVEPYILFPLHYSEDAQITFREPLMSQVELVRNISRALPYGYWLYVKPHPHYLGTDTSLRELREMSRLENVRIIDPMTSPQILVSNAKAVVTINSTTGFEALINGISVVTFGHDFYCRSDLCYVVRDMNDLAASIMKAIGFLEDTERERSSSMRNFVAMTFANTIFVEGADYGYVSFGISDSDGKRIAEAFERIVS